MKILQVVNAFKPSWEYGGPTKVAYELSCKLKEKGHDVTVYTMDGYKIRLNVAKNKPVNVDGIKTYYFTNLSTFLTMKLNLLIPYLMPFSAKEGIKEFDVIHIHEHRTILAIITHHYAKKYNVPYVLQEHGNTTARFRKVYLKKLFDLAFGFRILRDASKVLALTDHEVHEYIQMGVDKSKIEIIPNGLNLYLYNAPVIKGNFKKKLSIADNTRIILFLGRIHEIKGIDLLVDVFADLVKDIDNLLLVIIGPDDGYKSELQKQIHDLKIDDRVLFTGPINPEISKLEAYTDAEVYVLPSRSEGFPMTILESWICGTPVVVTEQCNVTEIVNNRGGLVVRFDKEELKCAIKKLLNDKEMSTCLGQNGRQLVLDYYNLDKISEKVEKVYADSIKQKS